MDGLIVSPAPHIKGNESVLRQMQDVLIALIPAFWASIYFFGLGAAVLIVSAILSALVFEVAALKIRKKEIARADIASAMITGLLLAFCVSSAIPWWMMVMGSFVAIVIVKHAFGGLGFNIFNPALVGRAFLLASWPAIMTTWVMPFNAVTSATPLTMYKHHGAVTDNIVMFMGKHAGSLGETSILALLIGAGYLLFRKTIDYRIPVSYLSVVILISAILKIDIPFHLMAGGLLLGAFFMATDPITSPVTKPGRWVFGAGCGLITMVIRLGGGYPEGVCYAILIMNAVTPLLDRYLQGKVFGK